MSCPPPPHLFAGHAAHHDSRKDVVAALGTRSRTSPLGDFPLNLVERLLVDERREGVLDHDRSIAADGPVADMVEPPLRHLPVDQRSGVGVVLENHADVAVVPFIAESGPDAALIQFRRDLTQAGIGVGVAVEDVFDGVDLLGPLANVDRRFPVLRLAELLASGHPMHQVARLVIEHPVVAVRRGTDAVAFPGLLHSASQHVLRQRMQELILPLPLDGVHHPTGEVVPVDVAMGDRGQSEHGLVQLRSWSLTTPRTRTRSHETCHESTSDRP